MDILFNVTQLTIQKQIVHSTNIGLSLSTNGSDTIRFSTVTSLGIMANQSVRNGVF